MNEYAENSLAMQVERFVLPSGNYRVGFRIDDLNDSTRGVIGKMKLLIVPYVRPSSQKVVSDAMLLAQAPSTDAASEGKFTRCLNGRNLRLQPNPSHVFERDQDSLRIYHEAYNLVKVRDSIRVVVRYLLYTDRIGSSKDPNILGQFVVRDDERGSRFYRSFSLEEIPKGEHFLVIETIDLNDPENLDLTNRRWTAIDFKMK